MQPKWKFRRIKFLETPFKSMISSMQLHIEITCEIYNNFCEEEML